ncbi:unnamed protein product [Withania somnifera]
MASVSANKISKTSVTDSLNLTDTRRRKQPKIFIILIIFFIVIIAAFISVLTMIKRDYDSELPANNPEKAIKSICLPTPYYDTCFTYMFNSLYKNNKSGSSSKITSSKIFSISLHYAIDELQKITNTLKSYNSISDDQSTPSQCNYLYFNSSLNQLKIYLAMDEVKNMTARMTMRSEMVDWLDTERPKIGRCLSSMEYEKGLKTGNVNNCLVILSNTKIISEMLDSSTVFNFDSIRRSGKSIVRLLFQDTEFVDTLCIFGVQFIFLLLLFCMLWRVW